MKNKLFTLLFVATAMLLNGCEKEIPEVHLSMPKTEIVENLISTINEDSDFNIISESPEVEYQQLSNIDAVINIENTSDIPPYNDKLWITINDNVPNFDLNDFEIEFENYSQLDSLGRCGVAYANLSLATMPTEDRGDISQVHPSGWNQEFYDDLPLWNRCHLIAFCLAGENDNALNLITGTEQFNQQGMWYFEDKVQDYIYETKNHVLYRVTPIYTNNNLVADGVQMEALSEDGELAFNVFVYNIEDNIAINYETGESYSE